MKKEFYNIAKLIDKNSKVLDVGCGNGDLMKYINENITNNIRGIEISKDNVQKCIEKGLTVIEGNAENDLKQFPELSFDYVILSQTLQAFLDPENVIHELLRIGKKAIVTIPNFGYWKVRIHLLFKGTMPVTENLPNDWYNTPNLHMCSIKDFVNFCNKRKIKINISNLNYQNLFSELGIRRLLHSILHKHSNLNKIHFHFVTLSREYFSQYYHFLVQHYHRCLCKRLGTCIY